MARRRYRSRRSGQFGDDVPGARSGGGGVGWVIFGGLIVATGVTVLAVRSANAAPGSTTTLVPPPPPPPPPGVLTPQQIAEMKANPETRFGPGHF